jgi:HEPN domain-containing protein
MSIEGQKFYPGETATPQQILVLANEYRRAAGALSLTGRRREPLSRARYRFVAIHAIELYLNALLLAGGHPSAKLRGLHHDLGSRTQFALSAKLTLRKRTLRHLQSLSESREYLITRYDPAASAASELNRLAATLEEVAEKVNRCGLSAPVAPTSTLSPLLARQCSRFQLAVTGRVDCGADSVAG